jgi:hypothetical protein
VSRRGSQYARWSVRVAELIEHYTAGLRYPAIAALMDLSANAVAAKAKRLQLAGVLPERRRVRRVPMSSRAPRRVWTASASDELRELWNQGYSAQAIGKHLGVSKNAVIGKANRLGLTPRPSPIIRAAYQPRQTQGAVA